jgi:hypothetical protein
MSGAFGRGHAYKSKLRFDIGYVTAAQYGNRACFRRCAALRCQPAGNRNAVRWQVLLAEQLKHGLAIGCLEPVKHAF